jgi:hypothetical protein
MKHTTNTILAAVAKNYSTEDRRRIFVDKYVQDMATWAAEKLDLTGCNPRHVYEWSTERKWEDLDAARKRNEALGESASCDLLEGYRSISQMMDWVATHMVLNPSICWRCAELAEHTWQCFPLCKECYALVNKPTPVSAEEVKTVQDRIAAVFTKASKKRPAHSTVCSNRRLRHSYVLKVPAGFLQYDGTLVHEMHQANKWTREEISIERHVFDQMGTPVSVFRVTR